MYKKRKKKENNSTNKFKTKIKINLLMVRNSLQPLKFYKNKKNKKKRPYFHQHTNQTNVLYGNNQEFVKNFNKTRANEKAQIQNSTSITIEK